MSDTLSNALRGGSVLDRIANPVVANPLAAYGNALTVANQVWANRQAQAEQAAGEAFQNSINPDGTTNQAQLLKNLAGNPTAALAAQKAAIAGQGLSSAEYTQRMARLTAGANGMLEILQRNKGTAPLSDVQQLLQRGVQDGHITQQDADNIIQNYSNDPVRNGQIARQGVMQSLQTQEAVVGATPRTVLQDVGGHLVPVTQQPALSGAPGQLNVGGGPEITRTMTPGEAGEEKPIYVKNPDGTYSAVPQARSARPGAATTPTVTQLGGNGLPVPPIPPAGGGAATGGGAPPPLPQKGAPAIPGAYQQRGAAQPTPQTAAQPTPQTAAQPAPEPGSPQLPLLAPPQGQPDRLAAGNKLYADASAAVQDQQKRLIAGESALEAMKLAATGPGTGWFANAKAYLEARGEDTSGTQGLSEAAARQVLQKQLLRFADNQSKASGTDLRLETQLHSNANPDMLASANRHVLVQDIGILRRDMAMNKTMPQGEAALDHVKSFPTDTDPRAFAYDVMTKAERDAIRAQLAKDPAGQAKFNRSLQIAHEQGLIKTPGQ